jgi:hypothetical protein
MGGEYGDRVTFKLSGTTAGSDRLGHFLVVGKDAYRIEQPHPDLTGTEITDFSPEVLATICFNDSDRAGSLADLFDSLWEVCHPVALRRPT